jgi:hypothetical protein
MIVGFDNPDLILQNSGDSVAVAASLAREDLSMGEPERFKFVRRVHVRKVDGSGILYVRVGARPATDAPISYGAERPLADGETFINTSAMGRFLSVAIRGEDADEWAISGVDMEYEDRGYL